MAEYKRFAGGDPALVGSSEARAAWHHVAAIHVDELDEMKRKFFELTALEPGALDRMTMPGHLTGSAVVFNHDATETLLLFHTKLQRWLQPGGHADGEANKEHSSILSKPTIGSERRQRPFCIRAYRSPAAQPTAAEAPKP